MDLRNAFFGSRLRIAGTVLGSVVLLVVVLFLAGVFGLPSVVGFENQFGEVTENRTVILSEITVRNPNPFGIGLGSLSIDYTATLNGIEIGQGRKNGLYIGPGNTTVRLETIIDNGKIPAWWVSHLSNDQVTNVQVQAELATGLGYSTTRTPVNRTIETNILETFNTTTDQPINASFPLVENPVAVIRQRNASFGTVSRNITTVEVSFVVYNPKTRPLVINELGYDVSMNEIDMGSGQTNETYVIGPESERTIETTVQLQNQRLDEWWASHIENGQSTLLRIDFSARLSIENVGTAEIPLEGVDYETRFETDLFGGGSGNTSDISRRVPAWVHRQVGPAPVVTTDGD